MIAAFSMSEDNNAQHNSLGEEFVLVGSQSPERNLLSRSILNYASPSPESNLSELTNSTSNSPSHSAAVELSPSDEEKINCELSLLRESDVNKPTVKSFHGIIDGSKVELQLQELSYKLKEDLTYPTAMRYPFPIQNPSHILSPSPRLPSIDQLTSAINTRVLGTIPRSASAPPSVLIGSQESFNVDIEDDFLEVRGRYKVLEKIGEGTFSSVYKAVACDTAEIVALKRIYSTCRPARILNEIQHLKTLGGKCYVPELLGGLRFQDQVTLVIPYFEHDKFKDYLITMNLTQIRQYMKALFEALQHLHTNGVIHRDIKPGNFLYDVKNNRYMLVDFGLAQSQHELLPHAPGFPPSSSTSILRTSSVPTMSSSPSMLPATATTPTSTRRKRTVPSAANEEIPPKVEKKQKRTASSPEASVPTPTFTLNTVSPQSLINSILQNGMKKQMQAPRAGTRGFRAPEVLLKYPYQTTAIDIWSAGIILLCILSMRYPFFNSPDDLVALAEIGALCGTKEVTAAALALGRKVDFPVCIPKINIKDICIKLCGPRPYALPDSAYDLLSRCLELNPYTRISAEDALQHPFFTETN